MFDAFQEALKLDGLAEENLQARIRAVVWMALSNQHGHLVLGCGNKSELATGYSTIYGDAVGGYAPIKDVPKTLVWELARWRNAGPSERGETPPIPEDTITKPPSAELRPGPARHRLAAAVRPARRVLDAYVERDLGSADLIAEGFDPALVERVIALVDRAEYKRRQYPTGPKISRRNFGRDRRVPITNRWREHLSDASMPSSSVVCRTYGRRLRAVEAAKTGIARSRSSRIPMTWSSAPLPLSRAGPARASRSTYVMVTSGEAGIDGLQPDECRGGPRGVSEIRVGSNRRCRHAPGVFVGPSVVDYQVLRDVRNPATVATATFRQQLRPERRHRLRRSSATAQTWLTRGQACGARASDACPSAASSAGSTARALGWRRQAAVHGRRGPRAGAASTPPTSSSKLAACRSRPTRRTSRDNFAQRRCSKASDQMRLIGVMSQHRASIAAPDRRCWTRWYGLIRGAPNWELRDWTSLIEHDRDYRRRTARADRPPRRPSSGFAPTTCSR